MRLDISYNRKRIPLDISDDRIIKIVEPNNVPPVSEGDVIQAGLDNPVGDFSFESNTNYLLV